MNVASLCRTVLCIATDLHYSHFLQCVAFLHASWSLCNLPIMIFHFQDSAQCWSCSCILFAAWFESSEVWNFNLSSYYLFDMISYSFPLTKSLILPLIPQGVASSIDNLNDNVIVDHIPYLLDVSKIFLLFFFPEDNLYIRTTRRHFLEYLIYNLNQRTIRS